MTMPAKTCTRPIASDRAGELYEGFCTPPPHAKPYMRWWWHDNRLTREEICRELDLMQSVGIGGVEIDSIEKQPASHPTEIAPLRWMSPEWKAMLAFALDELHRRDMEADLLIGSSWPFGGPSVSVEDSAQRVQVKVFTLQGPMTFKAHVRDDVKPWIANQPGYASRWTAVRLVPEGAGGPGQDVTDCARADGSLELEIPAGNHRLYAVFHEQSFNRVGKPSPGAEGRVVNHFCRRAVDAYLDNTSRMLSADLGALGRQFRTLFCDSIELSKSNWNDDMPAEFRRRRGYEVEALLPFLLAPDDNDTTPFADSVRRARYDYQRTLAELFFERFLNPFHEWCHRNGVPSRYQAYGHPWLMDMLNGYMVPDFPEGDTWLFKRHEGFPEAHAVDGIRYEVWNKYASSGAHLTGRRIIGTESMTNLEGVFMATLGYVKQADDLVFMSGVNHSILHGFNNSPREAGVPGWVRFGTYFSEHNPWWPHLHRWTAYNARLSWVLQRSQPVVKVAILGPTADVWSRWGLEREQFVNTPWYLHLLWQAIQQNGRTADYVSEQVVQAATADGSTLRMGVAAYDLLIVVAAQAMDPRTAQAIERLAKTGRIAFIGMAPDRSAGLTDAAANDACVRTAMAAALKADARRIAVIEAPPADGLLEWTGDLLDRMQVEPCVRIAPPCRRVMQIHHHDGEREIYFFANSDRDQAHVFRACFPTGAKTPWVWCPESGQRRVYPHSGKTHELDIRLDPLESLLLVFEPGAAPADAPRATRRPLPDAQRHIEVSGPWSVSCTPTVGAPFTRTVERLLDFGASDDPVLASFSGTVVYRTEFTCTSRELTLLSLGHVADISEVILNGQSVGVRWYGLHRYEVGACLREGANTLEVRVTTLLSNFARASADPAFKKWMIKRRQVPAGLIGPVRLHAVAVDAAQRKL